MSPETQPEQPATPAGPEIGETVPPAEHPAPVEKPATAAEKFGWKPSYGYPLNHPDTLVIKESAKPVQELITAHSSQEVA